MRQDNLQDMSPAEVGRRLAVTRRARNLSQDDVARHLGVSRPTVVAMEKGTRGTKPAELISLAELYGCSLNELVGKRAFVPAFEPQFRVTQAGEVSAESVSRAV